MATDIEPVMRLLLDGQHHHHQHHFANSNRSEEAPTLTVGATVKTAVLTFLAGASILGNSATLINIMRRKKGTRSSMYTLLLQVNNNLPRDYPIGINSF